MGLIIDLFAGGGGASEGIRLALGRDPDIAINHSPDAIAMHAMNHPGTHHLCQDVWRVPPLFATQGRAVDLLWASPDCKDFSKAKGGKPRSGKIRDLAWVVVDWARKTKPAVIILENVEEFRGWGPLDQKDRRIKELEGRTFERWVRSLRGLGYRVDWRELRACDFGAPTIRKRLFLVARRDGLPIIWPEPSHGPGLLPFRSAAECIDWSLPCPSIFLDRKGAARLRKETGIICRRPLAENTMRRIAKGTMKYVIKDPEPFIVSYYGPKTAGVEFRGQNLIDPIKTQTCENRHGLVMPYIVKANHGYEYFRGQPAGAPLQTITAGANGFGLAAAHLVRYFGRSVGQDPGEPAPTATAGSGGKTGLVTSHLVKFKGSNIGQGVREPLQTITAGGRHFGEVRAFLLKYYGQGCGQSLKDPAHTLTSKERLGLVTVRGEHYAIADIGMRMLSSRELFTAQGFPKSYVIDRVADDRKLSKAAQVSLVGNSVSPPNAAVLVAANCARLARAAA